MQDFSLTKSKEMQNLICALGCYEFLEETEYKSILSPNLWEEILDTFT